MPQGFEGMPKKDWAATRAAREKNGVKQMTILLRTGDQKMLDEIMQALGTSKGKRSVPRFACTQLY